MWNSKWVCGVLGVFVGMSNIPLHAAPRPCYVDKLNDVLIVGVGKDELHPPAQLRWRVDRIEMDDRNNPAHFAVEPWDLRAHRVEGRTSAGRLLCRTVFTPQQPEKTKKPFVDPYPLDAAGNPAAQLAPPTKSSESDTAAAAAPEVYKTQADRGSVRDAGASGALSGVVMDFSGAVVPGADVTLTGSKSGGVLTVHTGNDGAYAVDQLLPDIYFVIVASPGFKPVTLPPVEVGPADRKHADASLAMRDDVTEVPTSAPAESTPVKVYYATERTLLVGSRDADFGGTRSPNLHYGVAVVTVPNDHPHHFLSDPLYWTYSPADFTASFSDFMTEPAFFSKIGQQSHSPGTKGVFVFVHGFNNGFREEIYKTAQLAHDSRFAGVPILFDWPANGTVNLFRGYATDSMQIGNSKRHLAEFLVELSQATGGEPINLVAHSMGNRLMLEALDLLRVQHQLPLLGQVIMAAPDIDATRFQDVMDPLLQQGKIGRVTLYGSHKDVAMWVSKHANSEYPVGHFPPTNRVKGVDMVDVSQLHMNIVGHDYFITARPVLEDIGVLLRSGDAPPRSGFQPAGTPPLTYWRLAAPNP